MLLWTQKKNNTKTYLLKIRKSNIKNNKLLNNVIEDPS